LAMTSLLALSSSSSSPASSSSSSSSSSSPGRVGTASQHRHPQPPRAPRTRRRPMTPSTAMIRHSAADVLQLLLPCLVLCVLQELQRTSKHVFYKHTLEHHLVKHRCEASCVSIDVSGYSQSSPLAVVAMTW
jgi:hypothetical protein